MDFSLVSRHWTMNALGNLGGLITLFGGMLLIFSVISFIKRQKEILMLRQLGYTNVEVLHKVFFKDSGLYFLVMFFFLIVLQLSSLYFQDELFSRFIAEFSRTYVWLLISIPLGLYGLNYALLLLFKYYYFKKRRVLLMFEVLFQMIKIGLIVSLIVPLINSAGIMKTSKENVKGFDDYPNYKESAMIELVYFGEDPALYSEKVELFYETIHQNGVAAYSIEDYMVYQEAGNSSIIEEDYENLEPKYPYIVVNPYFFEDFEVYDKDQRYSSKVDFSNQDTVIYPVNHKDKTLPTIAEVSSKTYSNHLELPNINGYLGKVVNPIIYVKQKFDKDSLYNFNMFYSTNERIDKIILDLVGHGISVRKGSVKDAIVRQENFSEISTLRFKEALFISVVGVVSFNLVALFLFFEKNSKKIAIDYIFGKTFLERYKSIITVILLSYATVIAFVYALISIEKIDGVFINRYLLPVIFILLLLDGLLMVINVKIDQSKVVSKVLKGGE